MQSDKESNFLRINKNTNKNILYDYIKVISNRKKDNIWNLLIVCDDGPLFWTKFINIILLLYAHILKVKVTLLYMWDEAEERNEVLLSNEYLTESLGYSLDIEYIFHFNYEKLKWQDFDLVILNLDVINIEKFYLEFNFEYIKYKELVLISYLNEIIIENLVHKKIKINFIFRQKLDYWFFSKIISTIYVNNIDFNNKKYDILIAWSIKWRDYNIIKYIITKKKNLKICIISWKREEIDKIKKIIWNHKNIDYELNFNSYSSFYKILNNSKIFLNCINVWEGTSKWYWSTWLLLAMSGKHIILSKNTQFYRKLIEKNKTGFLYDTYWDCILEIEKILSYDIRKIEKVWEIRYNHFHSNKQIEDYCDVFFKK